MAHLYYCLTLSSISDVETDDGDSGNLDRIGQAITDLIMWRDVAKSTLWFGLGSLCFLSSCFAQGISFRCDEVISCLAYISTWVLIVRTTGEG